MRFAASFEEEANFCAGANQVHTHSATCVKYAFAGGREKCRFGAPWPLVARTMFTADGGLQIKRNHPHVNRWNKAIAVGLRHNHDIHFIGTRCKSLAIIFYLTNYATKVEDPVWKRLAAARDLVPGVEGEAQKFLGKVANRVFTEQTLSQVEVVANLVGYAAEFSSKESWSFLNSTSLYWRIFRRWPHLRREADMESLDDAQEDAVFLGVSGRKVTLLDAYPYRGKVLADVSLYEYASLVFIKKRRRGGRDRWGENSFDPVWESSAHLIQQLRQPGMSDVVCLDGYLALDFEEEMEGYHRR